jgi:hypothetical protein
LQLLQQYFFMTLSWQQLVTLLQTLGYLSMQVLEVPELLGVVLLRLGAGPEEGHLKLRKFFPSRI